MAIRGLMRDDAHQADRDDVRLMSAHTELAHRIRPTPSAQTPLSDPLGEINGYADASSSKALPLQ